MRINELQERREKTGKKVEKNKGKKDMNLKCH